jgi:hypothetical protein
MEQRDENAYDPAPFFGAGNATLPHQRPTRSRRTRQGAKAAAGDRRKQ